MRGTTARWYAHNTSCGWMVTNRAAVWGHTTPPGDMGKGHCQTLSWDIQMCPARSPTTCDLLY